MAKKLFFIDVSCAIDKKHVYYFKEYHSFTSSMTTTNPGVPSFQGETEGNPAQAVSAMLREASQTCRSFDERFDALQAQALQTKDLDYPQKQRELVVEQVAFLFALSKKLTPLFAATDPKTRQGSETFFNANVMDEAKRLQQKMDAGEPVTPIMLHSLGDKTDTPDFLEQLATRIENA